jgi:hypothetical protein
METDAIYGALAGHLTAFWPDRAVERFVWTAGPLRQRLPRWRVWRFAPQTPADSWIYVTVGAWEARAVEPALEFFFLSRREDPILIESLAMLTYFHADTAYQALQRGEIVDLGRPWMDDSAHDHLLITLPYPFGPALEWCCADGFHVRFLWAAPISRAEAELCHRDGLEALEQRLERSGVKMTDPARPSVV